MDKSASQKTISDTLYPALGPFDHRMLDVGDGHNIYVEQCGNPTGKPIVVFHGGPGGGCSPAMRRFFDPEVFRIVLFDQRGCGRSTPKASVTNNTTWNLVSDIEKIRKILGIDRWAVFGGSWGSTLALVYAQTHPENVTALILRGIFLATKPELDWFYGGGAAQFWPKEWTALKDMIPKAEQGDLIAAYHRRLFSEDLIKQIRYARAWATWETQLAVLQSGERRGNIPADYARAFARLENHYFVNNSFLDEKTAILNNMDKISGIPGTIVQGRYDMICPPARAYALATLWPRVNLMMIPAAGHSLSEPGITAGLVAATDALRD